MSQYVENNTWTCGDMEFIFECPHRYRTSERSEQVRCRMWTREDKFHISKRPCIIVFIMYLLYKHTNNNVFDDFPKISDHFPKISEDFPKLFRRLDGRLRTVSEDWHRLPKVAEYFRGGTDDISIIQHHLWVLFKQLCSYSNGNLKNCDNILIFSQVKLSYFYMWKYMDFLSGRIKQ